MVRLFKAIGPAASAAIDSRGNLDRNSLATIVHNLAGTLSEADFDYLCEAFASGSSVQVESKFVGLSEAGVFDLHFAGKYGDLLQWLWFCVEVNFGNFLGDMGIGKATASAPQDSAANTVSG